MSTSESPKLYSEREEWKDITPVPQHDTFQPMAPIFYTDECQ
jgi:protein farnesyltransferase/geranylgeranyltransferase type-1 subunit alpha